MRFDTKSSVKIVMLGAGGTGAHIAPHLYRLLYASGRKTRVVIADGDVVEEKNLVRQNFSFADVGVNKARAIATRYASAFKMKAEFIPDFIETPGRLRELVTPEKNPYHGGTPETVILIGAVDNNSSRKLCDEIFRTSKDLIYIDSGNGEFSGQVACGIRRNGKTLSKPIGSLYPDILSDDDKFPSELSCAEASVSAPQSISANVTAAAVVVDILYNIVVCGECRALRAVFSTRTVNVKAETRKTRRKAA
ncbi:MAG: ThiF family adenylyltransferase [Oscillospiraceae bacterium]|jgi:molybdopterin/thiamine biosynthesis adenylyltransferase|nr:ThiF family adenylyltransferase [Oscillospiraceae bacterium]